MPLPPGLATLFFALEKYAADFSPASAERYCTFGMIRPLAKTLHQIAPERDFF